MLDTYTLEINLDKIMSRQDLNIPNIGDIVDRAITNALKEFVDMTIVKIYEILAGYGLGSSRLASTVNVQVLDSGISISMGSDYAVFVEYGTGIEGATSTAHPKASEYGWVHMSGEYSSNENGWWYPTHSDDPNPTKTFIDGKLYAFTRGLPSRPFMFDTWMWARFSVTNTIDKHIRRELKKLEGELA